MTLSDTATAQAPWLPAYGDVPSHIEYPKGTMCDAVFDIAEKYPNLTALSFMGQNISYRTLKSRIEQTAKAFYELGVREGDRVTVCLPNIPQTVYCLYALNRIGALASMIHPLSAETEIIFYLNTAKSDTVVMLDQFYAKFEALQKSRPIKNLIVASIGDAMNPAMRLVYKMTLGRSVPKVPKAENVILWKRFIAGANAHPGAEYAARKKDTDPAVILFSGGTTGTTKGILLTNLNFNALALQTAAMSNVDSIVGKSMLAAMPMFHGFGLGVCVHTMLAVGGRSILVPRFNVKEYAKLVKNERPNFIAGVPTLYEALIRNPYMEGVKLDNLKGVFSGGDSLSVELKKKFDAFLAEHGATVRVREGYGTTECVTASCLTPYNIEKEGSIGIPYPDTFYAICKAGSTEEVPYGEEGEICLRGPSVMVGYLDQPEESANALRLHSDGNVWLHTGDLGMMDSDGFIYFRQRIKRMIITSGYNVYPSQLENIIDGHEAVQMSCVIGVRDPLKMQRVKAFVTLKPGYTETPELKADIMEYCKKHIAKYAIPREIEIRDALPKTLVGKVAYTVLEKEEEEKAKTEAQG